MAMKHLIPLALLMLVTSEVHADYRPRVEPMLVNSVGHFDQERSRPWPAGERYAASVGLGSDGVERNRQRDRRVRAAARDAAAQGVAVRDALARWEASRFDERAMEVALAEIGAGLLDKVPFVLEAENIDSAYEIANTIDHVPHRSIAQARVARAMATAGRDTEAIAVARAIPDIAVPGLVSPDEILDSVGSIEDATERERYLWLVSTLQAHAGLFMRALNTARAISTADIRLGAISAASSAQAYAGFFHLASASAEALGTGEAQDSTLAWIARQQAEAGEFEAASATTHRIDDRRERAAALADLAAVQSQSGRDATAMFEGAMAAALAVTDQNDRYAAVQAIVAAQLRAGSIEDAFATAGTLDAMTRWKASTLAEVAAAQAESGLNSEANATFARALEAARALKHSEAERALAFEAVVSALSRAGRHSRAVEAAEAGGDPAPVKAGALASLAIATQLDGDWEAASIAMEAALATAQSARSHHERATALASVASALARARFFADAVATAVSIEDEFWRNRALREVVQAQSDIGLLQQSLETASLIRHPRARDALVMGAITSKAARFDPNRVLAAIALRQARSGSYEAAVLTAQSITPAPWHDQALASIAALHLENHQFAAALETAELMTVDEERDLMIAMIVGAQIQAGLFVQAEASAETIRDPGRRERAITLAADAQLADEALALLSATRVRAGASPARSDALEAEQAAHVMDRPIADPAGLAIAGLIDDTGRDRAFFELASALIAAGLTEEATAFASRIEDEEVRSSVLETVADAQATGRTRPE